MRAAKAALPHALPLSFWNWLHNHPTSTARKAEHASQAGGKTALAFGALFFVGYLVGIYQGRAQTSEYGASLASYYMDPAHFAGFFPLFVNLFSAALLQAVLVLICGFSALGPLLLGLYFAARGMVLGMCAAGVFVQGGTRGLVVHWMLTCLPDIGIFLVLLWLAVQANRCASLIFRSVVGAGGHIRTAPPIKGLAMRFLGALLLSVALCLLGAASGVVFAGVLL